MQPLPPSQPLSCPHSVPEPALHQACSPYRCSSLPRSPRSPAPCDKQGRCTAAIQLRWRPCCAPTWRTASHAHSSLVLPAQAKPCHALSCVVSGKLLNLSFVVCTAGQIPPAPKILLDLVKSCVETHPLTLSRGSQ